jgi:hypothetical protein
MLCDSFKTVMECIQRRLAADAQLLLNDKKPWFIDMRKQDELLGVKEAARQHKNKLSTYMMYTKEAKKMFDQTRCPWSSVRTIKVSDNTSLFVLVEVVPAKAGKEAQQGKPAKVQRVLTQTYGNDNVLQAAREAYKIVHVVDLTGFDWKDSESNMSVYTFIHLYAM